MVDFNAGYLPPGVYVQTQQLGSSASVGFGPTVLCLIGNGIGSEPNTETVSFAVNSAIVLAKTYIDPSSIVVSAQMDNGPQVFVADVGQTTNDYSITPDATAHTITITRHASGQIPTDRAVTITYNYADDEYYGLNRFTDPLTLLSVYGQPQDPVTGEIVSPLSFAALEAFNNGASIIYCVALDTRVGGTEQVQMKAAYNKTIPNYEINLMVPMWTGPQNTASIESYITDLESFITTAYSEQFPRMALVGFTQGYLDADPDVVAQAATSRRVVLFWPNQFQFFNTVTNSTDIADGYYFAAACAGVLAGQSPNRGLTQAQVKGFSGIPLAIANTMTTSQKNTWSSKGVSVAELNRNGQLVVRHGVTTDFTSIGNREISIVRCQDALYTDLLLTLLNANLIGSPITPDTPMSIKALVIGILANALQLNIIQAYAGLIVQQGQIPTGDPTVIQVTFSYQPTYPLNYITVSFTLDLTTNSLSLLQDTSPASGSTTQSNA